MRQIRLRGLELEGFRSFKTRTLIEFSPEAGLKFLSGDNQVEPALGANGAGKSSVWDALAYCLTGTSVRGLKASNLQSWGAEKIWVASVWDVDGRDVRIQRSGNPDRLSIDDRMVAQLDVDRLIGLSRNRLLQSVLFGQSVPFFIDLTGPERGTLLDEVLDMSLWLKATDQASRWHTSLTRDVSRVERDLAHAVGKLEGMESADTIQVAIDLWDKDQTRRIDQAISQLEDAEDELQRMKPLINSTKAAVDALPNLAAMQRAMSSQQKTSAACDAQYKRLFGEIDALAKKRTFYRHSMTCDECGQAIARPYAHSKIATLGVAIRDLGVRVQLNTARQSAAMKAVQDAEDELGRVTRKREFLIEQRSTAVAQYAAQERIVDGAETAAERVMEAVNPHTSRRDGLAAERITTETLIETCALELQSIKADIIRADFWRAGFKRVRLFLVNRVLGMLQVETAAAATALGLTGWSIRFSTELETKSGGSRPGIHVIVASPEGVTAPWEVYSGGEGQRIRLSVSLGLANLIQRMAGVSLNIEVYDEPGAWLSVEGIHHFIECLKHRVYTTGKSIWVSSHSGIQNDAFSESWCVYKTDSGSHVRQITAQH